MQVKEKLTIKHDQIRAVVHSEINNVLVQNTHSGVPCMCWWVS